MDIYDHLPSIVSECVDPVVVMEIGVGRAEDTLRIVDLILSKGKQYHYFGFEAEQNNVKAIQDRVGPKITVVPHAVGDKDGETEFISSGAWALSGSVKQPKEHLKSYPWIPWQQPTKIKMTRLDTVSSENRLTKVDFIWMDVQGAEDLVIAGGIWTLARTRYLYTEFYNTEEYTGQIGLDEIIRRLPGKWEIVKTWVGDIAGSGNVLLKNLDYPPMRYLLGSGFFNNPCAAVPVQDMANHWLNCISQHAYPKPERIVVVTAGGNRPYFAPSDYLTVIACQGDIGNLSHKIAGHKTHDFAGWMPPMAIAAMIAYNEELDFVFQEQDCLAFGPYIRRMYADMGSGNAAIGPAIGGMGMEATQSLFIVRHAYIWQFIRDYFICGPDDNDRNQGEKKFARMKKEKPDQIKTLSFGVDRDRPIPWDQEVFFAQQWSQSEITTGVTKGLIP